MPFSLKSEVEKATISFAASIRPAVALWGAEEPTDSDVFILVLPVTVSMEAPHVRPEFPVAEFELVGVIR